MVNVFTVYELFSDDIRVLMFRRQSDIVFDFITRDSGTKSRGAGMPARPYILSNECQRVDLRAY